MKRIFLTFIYCCILTAIASACSKNTDVPEPDSSNEACELQLSETTLKLAPGETKKIPLKAKLTSESNFKTYYWQNNVYGLKAKAADPSLISIYEGRVTSLGPIGQTEITITPENGDPVKLTVVVDYLSYRKVYNKDKQITAENIYLKHVCTKKWIQSFELNSKGDVYILSSLAKDPWLSIFRYSRNGELTGEMRIAYASHGTTCSLEETPEGDYIWLPTYGTKTSSNEYKRDQLFTRVKFENGKEWSPDDEEFQLNSYYLGDFDNLLPSIDFENGQIGIRYLDLDDKQWVAVYNLKDIVDSPINQIRLAQSIKRGGESTGPVKGEEIVYMSFKAHDCSKLKPTHKFNFTTKEALGNSVVSGAGHALQGFCVADGYAYFTYGYVSNFDAGYSVYDFNGKQLVTRQLFTFLQDKENLKKHGIASKKFEPEGVRVKNGRMYLGAGVYLDDTPQGQGLETILVLPN